MVAVIPSMQVLLKARHPTQTVLALLSFAGYWDIYKLHNSTVHKQSQSNEGGAPVWLLYPILPGQSQARYVWWVLVSASSVIRPVIYLLCRCYVA